MRMAHPEGFAFFGREVERALAMRDQEGRPVVFRFNYHQYRVDLTSTAKDIWMQLVAQTGYKPRGTEWETHGPEWELYGER